MKGIKKIEIVFENCDYIEFEPKDFGTFTLDNITTCINRVACNSIAKTNDATSVAIEIFKRKIESTYLPFGMFGEEPAFVKDRLTEYKDITYFVITYDDGTTDKIYAPWSGEYTNELQKYQIGENGNLYIVISVDENISDYFPEETMKDERTSELVCD